MKWERVIPWITEHEVQFFLCAFGFLVIVGLGSC